MLLEPSVNKIITLLLAFESFNLETALANPMPTAVPSAISPLEAISVRTPCNRFNKEAWSVVIGHWVNASPANIVNPILSFALSEMNSAATFFAASILLGLRSSASIDVETSIASIISIPSTDLFPHELWVCGRTRIITIQMKVTILKKTGRCKMRILQLFFIEL